jgi:carbon-monoxide dehydrogenase medium subunit
MLSKFDYTAPATSHEAIADLGLPGTRPLAGGQGLLTAMKLGRLKPPRIVDLRRIPELQGVTESAGGGLRIGAMTTLTQLADVPGLPQHYPALATAAGAIADPQVRNRGTVGGALVDHFAASDLAAALLVYGATLDVIGAAGRHTVAVADFYTTDGPGLGAADIVAAVNLPAPLAGHRTAYERRADRATLSPLVGVAVSVPAAGGPVRVAVTGATRWPALLPDLPAGTEGAAIDVGPASRFVDDDTMSAVYRMHLTRTLIGAAIRRAGSGHA